MTPAVEQLLQAFAALTDAEKQEAVAEILRRAPQALPPELPDKALADGVEELFTESDAREAADRKLPPSTR